MRHRDSSTAAAPSAAAPARRALLHRLYCCSAEARSRPGRRALVALLLAGVGAVAMTFFVLLGARGSAAAAASLRSAVRAGLGAAPEAVRAVKAAAAISAATLPTSASPRPNVSQFNASSSPPLVLCPPLALEPVLGAAPALTLWSAESAACACVTGAAPEKLVSPVPPAVDCAQHGLKPRGRPAFLIDTFLFNNEVDVLLLRLLELDGVVDQFIFVESSTTFTGQAKNLTGHLHAPCFRRWRQQIDAYVQPPLGPGSAWKNEHATRNALVDAAQLAIKRHLGGAAAAGVNSADEILVATSDLDELPRADSYAVLKYCSGAPDPVGLTLDKFFYYSFNWLHAIPWARGPRVASWRWWLEALARGKGVESTRWMWEGLLHAAHAAPAYIARAGWHISYFLTVEQIQQKMAGFSHTELDLPPFNTAPWIQSALLHGFDVFNRTQYPLLWQSCSAISSDDLPQAFLANREYFGRFCPLSSPPSPRLRPH